MRLVLYRRELYARPHYGLMALTTGALCTVSMLYAYMNITQMSLDKLFADTLSYNLYEKGYGTNHLNQKLQNDHHQVAQADAILVV